MENDTQKNFVLYVSGYIYTKKVTYTHKKVTYTQEKNWFLLIIIDAQSV